MSALKRVVSLFYCLSFFLFFSCCLGTSSNTYSHVSQNGSFTGRLNCGLAYTLLPGVNSNGNQWVEMHFAIPETDYLKPYAILTQQTIFSLYSTKQIKELTPCFFFTQTPQRAAFQLELPEDPALLEPALIDMKKAIFDTTLNQAAIEAARETLIQNGDESDAVKAAIAAIPYEEIAAFHEKWYREPLMHLLIVSRCIDPEIQEPLERIFPSPLNIHSPSDSDGSELTPQREVIMRWIPEANAYLVDEKIWLDSTNWISYRMNGKALGFILTSIGAGFLCLTIPGAAPLALISGGLTSATGLFFLLSNYPEDPFHYKAMRQEDLIKGFMHAYTHHREQITFTPYERRMYFLRELKKQLTSQSTCSSPLLLSELYPLEDLSIASLFTPEERYQMDLIKKEFFVQGKQLRSWLNLLEVELSAVLLPYSQERDRTLALLATAPSIEDKEAAQSTIERIYQGQLESCQQILHYAEKKSYYEGSLHNLVHHYNAQLLKVVMTFPLEDFCLKDALDLRTFD